MTHSAEIDKLAEALAAAREKFAPITRSKTVKVQGARGSYEFSYAPFEEIVEATREALRLNGLSVVQSAENGTLMSVLIHSSGQIISCEVPLTIAAGSTPQQVGSALTYARRYGYTMLLCLTADDDDDANAAEGNSAEVVKSRQTSQAAPGSTPDRKRYSTVKVPADPDKAAEQQFREYLKSPQVLVKLSTQGWNMTALGQRGEIGDMAALNLLTKLVGRPLVDFKAISAEDFQKGSAALADIRDGSSKLADYGEVKK